jgi:hypothetical protein
MQWRALHGCGGSKRGSLRPRRPRQRGLARTGDVRFCFARSLVARPSSRRARERAMAWIRRRRKTRAARRAMKRATIEQTTELSSARRGGGGGVWRRGGGGVVMVVGGPFVRRGGLGPAGRGGHSGRTQRTFARWGLVWANPTTNKTPEVHLEGYQNRHASTEVRALPALHLHRIGLSWEGSHNSISGARRSL